MAIPSNILPMIWLLLGFGFIIFVHELGHFLAAKLVGIKVTQFAICFGHALVTWRKGIGFRAGSSEKEYQRRIRAELARRGRPVDEDKELDTAVADRVGGELGMGETEYRINWIPMGGYVKMLGQEDLDPTAQSSDPRSFNRKPAWARAIVISAGVVVNLIFGVIFFVLAFMAGVEFPPAQIGAMTPGSAAEQAVCTQHPNAPQYRGLRPGDDILTVDGNDVTDMMEVAIHTALSDPGKVIRVRVQREGEPAPLDYDALPQISELPPRLLALGIEPPMSLEVSKNLAEDDLPALLRNAGVRPGMTLSAAGDRAIRRFDQFRHAIIDAQGAPVTVTFSDASKAEKAEVAMRAEPRLVYSETEPVANLAGLTPTTRVAAVEPKSAAAVGGIQPGDVLARVGDVLWPELEEVREVVNPDGKSEGDRPLVVDVLRGETIVHLDPITPRNGLLGIHMTRAVEHAVVATAMPGTPGDLMNLTPGSRIVLLDDHVIHDFGDLQRWLAFLSRRAVEKGLDRLDVAVTAEMNVKDKPQVERTLVLDRQTMTQLMATEWSLPSALGREGSAVFDLLRVRVAATNPITALKLGVRKTHQFMVQTYITIARLIQGSVRVEHLRGPVGIVDEGRHIAKQGWPYLMFFLGLISANLVVLNFLPIPIVDGGLMVMLIIEKLKGSPLSARIQTAATLAGLVLIGGIFLVTFYYDMLRLMQ
ncbi:MAG: site-2 protease family protein [Phycisphaeraceae bacterium]|nr:site-2 protease family protein [Phycisphaeraceae bacterium]